MAPRFKIIHSSTSFTNRPPISFKIIEYLENYINDNLLTSKKIIVKSNWEVHLLLTFGEETERYKADYIFMPKGPPRIVKEDKVKIYEAVIPMKLIGDSPNPLLKTIELIYEAITIFLVRTYKKVNKGDMAKLWKELDLEYLLSFPYPAPIAEQKYLTDVVLPNGEVQDSLRRSEWLKGDHLKKPT